MANLCSPPCSRYGVAAGSGLAVKFAGADGNSVTEPKPTYQAPPTIKPPKAWVDRTKCLLQTWNVKYVPYDVPVYLFTDEDSKKGATPQSFLLQRKLRSWC